MTTQVPDPRPNFEFHEKMFLMGDPAAPAIAGIRSSKIADTLEAYEKLYAAELAKFPEHSPTLLRPGLQRFLARLFGFDHWRNANQIARMELKDLALAHATVLNSQVAKAAQEDLNAQYIKIGGDLNDFHHFLLEHFRSDLIAGIDLNKSLFQITKELMLELKKGKS